MILKYVINYCFSNKAFAINIVVFMQLFLDEYWTTTIINLQERQFYLYALYNKNKPKSDNLMTEYGSQFFRNKQLEIGDKMDLASYLLKPVQRMGKYALLLTQVSARFSFI